LVACTQESPRAAAPAVPDSSHREPTDAATTVARAGDLVVRGTLVHHGRPLAGLHLQLCGEGEANISWSTPCERAAHKWTLTTRSDGAFELASLPRLDLQLFILDEPFHTQTFILSEHLLGPTRRDLGTREVASTTDR
jgi:hypothetical protein